ncbi:MAG: hypothetical protein LBV49_08870 [Azonexus sp.]|nr:hypothetical protein [Azonexus sp.]
MNKLSLNNIAEPESKLQKLRLICALTSLLAVICSFIAAIYAFQYDSVAALSYGFIALFPATAGVLVYNKIVSAEKSLNTPNPGKPAGAKLAESPALPPPPDPKAHVAPRSKVLLIAYWLIFLTSFAFPAFVVFAIPAFEEVFQNFGVDLPNPTAAVINYRFALFVWPLIAFVPAVLISLESAYTPRIRTNHIIGFWLLLLILCCSAVIVVGAMYLPIFNLSRVV